MDNTSFHRSDRISQMCEQAGIKLVYLPAHSPYLNPIEELFAELKGFIIRRNWSYYEGDPDQGSGCFLDWFTDKVGERESARGRFRHAGLTIETIEDSDT
ncbi:hypothetical protein PHISCL_06265 [Aspergillus sclerotialis]|uniref:Tc1-like transposase DDE domain-containing protein n=1 Tax=Aspergillus sclerotialis TaxID=2070753 RepID=A0A3A2ZTU7_9EURO|nr:hypothetical protein PHISCL_06265 [Aspergillus sclerotialis]